MLLLVKLREIACSLTSFLLGLDAPLNVSVWLSLCDCVSLWSKSGYPTDDHIEARMAKRLNCRHVQSLRKRKKCITSLTLKFF